MGEGGAVLASLNVHRHPLRLLLRRDVRRLGQQPAAHMPQAAVGLHSSCALFKGGAAARAQNAR